MSPCQVGRILTCISERLREAFATYDFLTWTIMSGGSLSPRRSVLSNVRSPRHLEAASAILEKFERLVREGPGMNWVRQRALCSLYFFVAEQWVAAGSLSVALRSWRHIRQRR